VSRSGEPITIADTIVDQSLSLFEQAVAQERIDTLYRYLREQLTAQERDVLFLRYGLQYAYREHSVELGMRRRDVQRIVGSAREEQVPKEHQNGRDNYDDDEDPEEQWQAAPTTPARTGEEPT
jgi:DNA-directed RNA polymerase specialized sigma24 family protein